MSGLYFIFPVLITILVSFLIVRAAAIALMMTGLDRKRAVFQALSSFSGTGFTTKEAEFVVNNPTRRRIVTWLMILGNAGFVTVIVTGTSTLVTSKGYTLPVNVLLLAGGIVLIYRVASRKEFIRKFERYIENKLVRSAAFEEEPVEDLLHLMEGYGLVKGIITDTSPLLGAPVSECKVCEGKVLILGIEREKEWLPIPGPQEKMIAGDRIVVYGNMKELKTLFKEE